MMKKRILSLILSIVLSVPSFFVFAEQEKITADNFVKEKLAAFGIIDSMQSQKGNLTRAQLSEFAVRMLGLSAMSSDALSPFSDVDATEKRRGYILTAYDTGLFSGTGENTFSPQEEVTVAQVSKVFVTALGYKALAEVKGGYPTGYLMMAKSLNLFKGLNIRDYDVLSVNDAMTVVLNTLETDIMESDKISYEGTTLKVEKNVTLLSEKLKIFKSEGILEADAYTSLYSKQGTVPGRIVINGITYYGESNLLGFDVECYYKTENDLNYIVYVGESRRNVITTVDAEDIIPENTSKDTFAYYAGEKTKEIKIPRSVSFLLNGKQAGITADLLVPDKGEVAFVDNDNDGEIEVISVTSYETLVVSGYSKSSGMLAFKYGKTAEDLDEAYNEFDVFITKNGKKISAEDLREWNVVLMAKSTGEGRNKKVLIVSDKKAEGTVEAIGEDYIVIGEETYKISQQMLQKLSAGITGIFYIDAFDEVVASNAVNDIVYGYLYAMAEEKLDGYKLKIFTENNRWVTLFLKEKLNFNNESKTDSVVYKALKEESFPGKHSDGGMLICYNVDNDGKINRIFTPKKVAQWSNEAEEAEQDGVFRLEAEISSALFRDTTHSFENIVYLDGNTKIFCVPEDSSAEDFQMVAYNKLNGDEAVNNIYAYDMEKNGTAGAVVISTSSFNVNPVSNLMLVYKTYPAINKEKNLCYLVEGSYKGFDMKIYTKDQSMSAILPKKGDIIQFMLDDDGYLSKVSVRYSAADGDNQKFAKDRKYLAAAFIAGEVYYADGGAGRIVIDYGTEKGAFDTATRLENVYLYNKRTNKVTTGTIHDIEKGDDIFGRFRFYQANEIFVITEE